MYLIEMAPTGRNIQWGPRRPLPPHTQADLGVGGQLRERELGHVTIPGQRGGDSPRHRSRDTSFIGGVMLALSLIGPMPGKGSKYSTGKRTFFAYVHGRAILLEATTTDFCL